jgi:hypothetical protein
MPNQSKGNSIHHGSGCAFGITFAWENAQGGLGKGDGIGHGDACLYSLMEAKMKDVPSLMEGLVEDESQGGRSGKLPSAFIVPMFMFYKAIADGEIDEAAYVKAIRANIMAGGDTCCRAILIGAVMAAAAGSVPESFVEKFSKETMTKIDEGIAGIVDAL